MAEIIVTSTADSGAGSLRQAIADAQDGDVILFDTDVFPVGETTVIYLTSYLSVNKSISIYGGESDENGGYTSGATKRYYVYRDVEDVQTKVYIDDANPALEGETTLFELSCRVALDGQETHRCLYSNFTGSTMFSGIAFTRGQEHSSGTSGGGVSMRGKSDNIFNDCLFFDCLAAAGGGFNSIDSANVLNGCVLDSNTSTSNGGGFYISGNGSQNSLNDCVIVNCTSASSGGGGTATSDSQNVFNRCVVYGCSSYSGGGFYFSSTSLSTMNNCTISDCETTQGSGGGCYLYSASYVELNNCVIKNCNTVGDGGFLYSTNTSRSVLSNCSITSCKANNGGAFSITSSSNCNLVDCIIDNNVAINVGGCLYTSSSSTSSFTRCVISGCSATNNGGGFAVYSSAQINIVDCRISGCTANYGGGVFSTTSSQNTLNGCTIANCSAAIIGGGVYSTNTSQNTLNGCTISESASGTAGREGVVLSDSSILNSNNSVVDHLYIGLSAILNITNNITTVGSVMFGRNSQSVATTVTINDGAALTLTNASDILGATFTSAGRGYLAVGEGINTSGTTLTNVVLCAYGADVSSFAEVDGVLEWSADDPSVSVLLEREVNDAWTTLAQTTGDELEYYLPPKVNLRLFDGERFLTTATPDSRTYFYIGGAEGSFDDAEDWSLTKDGTAIPQSPTIADCAFVIQGAEGDVAISKGSANVTNATIIPAGTNDIAVTVDEATVLAGTERFTGTLTTTGDVTITGDASKLAIVVDGTLEVAGSLKLATLTLTSGSSVVFASADDVLVVTGSATVNDATFSCEEPTAYFTAPVGTDLTQATFTNVYVATKGAEVVSVTGSRFGKNYSINIISEDNTLPVTVEYRLEGTTEWIVADPAFVGTTFQISLDDEATFRVYNGEKFTEATMKVYGLYNEMAAIVEIGYLI